MLKKLLQKTCEGGIIKEDMKIFEPKERNGELCEKLLEIWESSVRATHGFLSDGEIEKIKFYVPYALR